MREQHKKESPILSLLGMGGGGTGLALGGAGGGPTHIIELFGGGGGSGAVNSSGGSGGYSKVEISLAPGTYYVTAGVKGYNGLSSGARNRSAGGNGLRQKNTNQGGSGGGFSALWANNSYSGSPILLVGGAGGSDWGDMGGDGGGVNQNGGTGWDNHNNANEYKPLARPIGATLTAGGFYNHANSGPASSPCNGEAGVSLRGGDSTCTNDDYSGGGGGGGYYGGGAGTGNVGQGGTPGSGGSGYADTSNYAITIITNTSPTQRNRTFNPTDHSMYWQPNNPGASLGSGNWGGGGTMASDGQHGRVRIYAANGTTLLHDITGGAINTSVTL